MISKGPKRKKKLVLVVGQKVRKIDNYTIYCVNKVFDTFVEIEKINKSGIETVCHITEYVDSDKLEEVDEDITGGCTSDS